MVTTAIHRLTLDPMGKLFQNASSLKPLRQLKPNCPWMNIGRSSTKFLFLYADRKFQMATTAGHRLTLDPMGNVQMPSSQKLHIWLKLNCTGMFIGWSSINLTFFVPIWNSKWRLRQDLVWHWTLREKCLKRFFSETTWIIETKLPRNDHWKVLYKVSVFYADRISKMAATAGHKLTLDPMENIQTPSSQKLQIWLKPNCTWMFIGWSSTILRFSLFRYEIQNGGYGRT
jgi:hypothetical protein